MSHIHSLKYTLAIDTDSYAGNFEREMFAFIFGHPDTRDGGTRNFSYYIGMAPAKDVIHLVDELLEDRIRDPGDDGYHRAFVTILPTPGLINDGERGALPDTEANRFRVKVTNPEMPDGWPAFYSVGIFLQREPSPKELQLIKERASLFKSCPKKHDWDQRPIITGFRLLIETTTLADKPL